MLFPRIEQVECSNTFKGIRNGFVRLIGSSGGMRQVQSFISQEDSEDQDQSPGCCICLVSDTIANKKALKVDGELKKIKLDPTAKVSFPRYLSPICELCLSQNDDKLKKHLRDIILYWFKDLHSIWKIQSNFRMIIPVNQDNFFTFQWVLYQFTNSKLTLLNIPIITIEDPTLLVQSSYAFVYNAKDKLLSAFEHKDFGNGILQDAMVDDTDKVKNHLAMIKELGEGLNERTKTKVALVNSEKYHRLYFYLKEKYLSYFVDIWSGASDPLRLISRHIVTAAYLLSLWEEERERKKCEVKQSFVHLKCGNGVLVHILNKEGHPGKGIDPDGHKMWESYDSDVILEESTIYPHKLKVEADWVIGFRSDELTSWIPIIAARSSCTTQFFLIPCCRYNLDKVFVESKVRNRVYTYEYSDYLRNIAETCGFKLERDTLPLKLYGFFARSRTTKIDTDTDYAANIDVAVKSLLKAQSCSADIDEEESCGTYSYKVMKRNLIDYTEGNHVMRALAKEQIINALLSIENIGYAGEDKMTTSGHKWSEWNAGGTLEATVLEKLVNPVVLEFYKAGIYGLLTHYKDVYYAKDGKVTMRDYRNENEMNNKENFYSRRYKQVGFNIKTCMCWFYRCHPQGCVLTAEQCHNAHGMDDASFLHEFY